MPAGLLNSLTEEEIQDLAAYLLSRGDSPGEPPRIRYNPVGSQEISQRSRGEPARLHVLLGSWRRSTQPPF